ncbi:MAG: heparinase II/III family protein [Saprospiraceae bacterium]|nr:heparinase II/III family protein [Saprospiraceae bacterium]
MMQSYLRIKYHRRKFINDFLKTMAGLSLSQPWSISHIPSLSRSEPLHDWSAWETYRDEVVHPCLTIKEKDLENARRNIINFEWADNYYQNILRKADGHILDLQKFSLDQLIEKTTPGDPLWTPCPSCRDKGLPVHPHGLWSWTIENPEIITCTVCFEAFPHVDYPESITMVSSWGTPQKITYYGGEPFTVFGFKQGLPSFTANIRSRKVQWCADASRTMAEAYLLSGNQKYAEETRKILLQFAECYPQWLVHVGYGEYADMDPKIAALHIDDLPRPEITPPPNLPDHKLWTAFWTVGRASGVGLESDFIRKVVEAYDFTCQAKNTEDKPVYSANEKIKIERDLLLESTILLVCDKKINNKSVSNRTAVALVGMCVGHPELVRFGFEGFDKTINEWYLKDGSTSETPFYGLMTLGGIWDLAQASRNYSDPGQYLDSNGSRFDHINLYQNPGFENVWQAFFNTLQGDLTYPSTADSFPGLKLDASYAELMAANYPGNPQFLSLLKEFCHSDLSKPAGPVPDTYYQKGAELEMISLELPYDLAKPQSPSSFSVYYREPGLYKSPSPPLTLGDWNTPVLKIPHLRTGERGRDSLLLMNVSDWGIHHEKDSLHLYYWKQGVEVLSDPGYLWDHPDEHNNFRTLAHNTIMINQEDQRGKGRIGEVKAFKTNQHVKLVEATSNAYEMADLYSRTSLIVDHAEGNDYVVDLFSVKGGDIQDYIFHIENLDFETDHITFTESPSDLYDLKNIRENKTDKIWQISWQHKDLKCSAWNICGPEETSYLGIGWGQRDWQNHDRGRQMPYIIRRTRSHKPILFASIFAGYSINPFIKKVELINHKNGLKITTGKGIDYITWSDGSENLKIDQDGLTLHKKSRLLIASTLHGKIDWIFTI